MSLLNTAFLMLFFNFNLVKLLAIGQIRFEEQCLIGNVHRHVVGRLRLGRTSCIPGKIAPQLGIAHIACHTSEDLGDAIFGRRKIA